MTPAFLPIDLLPFETLLEKDKELTKADLLKRATGKVSERLLRYLRQVQFCRIGKSANGSLYLL